ncbi:MAG: preprotein translocase subunit SecE [Planctomycetota bacterium]|nr:preprotein translocase subunit SecE [Planctomycetota bacterium]
MSLAYYKKGQGRIVRTTAAVSMALFLVFGCLALYNYVTAGWWTNILFTVPVAESQIRIGMLVSLGICVVGAIGLYGLVLNRPRLADFLIEVESEMYKVAWPSTSEWRGSSFVVILSVVLMGMFLFLVDQLLTVLMQVLGFGS